MTEPGHIYVLINPSIEGLVKIGKTTRDPQSRAKELSQATGVATPFYVAFSIEVADCHSAENYVYAVLEYNGFKRSPNREFFEMPLQSAIKVLTLAEKELREQVEIGHQTEQANLSTSEDDDLSSQHPGAAILNKAADVFFGAGDEIKDKKETLRLLHQAKALNFAPAFTALADYFMNEADELEDKDEVFAYKELREKALEFLKEGAQKGHGRCYVKMVDVYNRYWGNVAPEKENAAKCWKKYFRSTTFINDDDRKWACGLYWPSKVRCGASRVFYACQVYLYDVFLGRFVLDPEIRQILLPLRAEMIEEINESIEYHLEQEPSDLKNLNKDRCFLKFLESAL
jgi:hypothetical protein